MRSKGTENNCEQENNGGGYDSPSFHSLLI